jgi:hypothetical protein
VKTILTLTLFLFSFAASALQCKSLFDRMNSLAPQVSGTEKMSQFKTDFMNTTAKDLLTESFIAQLENEIGPVKKTVKFYDTNSDWSAFKSSLKMDYTIEKIKKAGYEYGFSVTIEAKKSKVMEFVLLLNKGLVKGSIENLSLQNPLNASDRLHLSQQGSKGISMQDFSKSVKFVKNFLAEHKLKQLVNGSSQNLLVSFLYRRLVGMQATEKSASTLKYFDHLLSKTTVSVNELNKSLGDINGSSDLAYVAKELNVKWGEVSRMTNHENFTPIYIENNLVGYKYLRGEAEPRYLLLDPRDISQQTFMNWRDLSRENRLGLVLTF